MAKIQCRAKTSENTYGTYDVVAHSANVANTIENIVRDTLEETINYAANNFLPCIGGNPNAGIRYGEQSDNLYRAAEYASCYYGGVIANVWYASNSSYGIEFCNSTGANPSISLTSVVTINESTRSHLKTAGMYISTTEEKVAVVWSFTSGNVYACVGQIENNYVELQGAVGKQISSSTPLIMTNDRGVVMFSDTTSSSYSYITWESLINSMTSTTANQQSMSAIAMQHAVYNPVFGRFITLGSDGTVYGSPNTQLVYSPQGLLSFQSGRTFTSLDCGQSGRMYAIYSDSGQQRVQILVPKSVIRYGNFPLPNVPNLSHNSGETWCHFTDYGGYYILTGTQDTILFGAVNQDLSSTTSQKWYIGYNRELEDNTSTQWANIVNNNIESNLQITLLPSGVILYTQQIQRNASSSFYNYLWTGTTYTYI